ncbi:MAG: 4'-phosphopantetheinyl transferase superfamily protein [Lewinellaceae bacterium]|nr:4'-phosphopantetheinyl transferase superfamily protein [Lewinellaceae bacterium]
MPLLLSLHPAPNTAIGLWQIAENEGFFREDLPLSAGEEQELALYKGIRRMEWLAGRWLLHKLSGAPQRLMMGKSAFSKPFFLDHPEQHCSLSHSQGIVGALLADKVCGCDVQVMVEKMPRIAGKFVSPDEMAFIHQHDTTVQFELFHIFWTAKESMYKAMGSRNLTSGGICDWSRSIGMDGAGKPLVGWKKAAFYSLTSCISNGIHWKTIKLVSGRFAQRNKLQPTDSSLCGV